MITESTIDDAFCTLHGLLNEEPDPQTNIVQINELRRIDSYLHFANRYLPELHPFNESCLEPFVLTGFAECLLDPTLIGSDRANSDFRLLQSEILVAAQTKTNTIPKAMVSCGPTEYMQLLKCLPKFGSTADRTATKFFGHLRLLHQSHTSLTTQTLKLMMSHALLDQSAIHNRVYQLFIQLLLHESRTLSGQIERSDYDAYTQLHVQWSQLKLTKELLEAIFQWNIAVAAQLQIINWQDNLLLLSIAKRLRSTNCNEVLAEALRIQPIFPLISTALEISMWTTALQSITKSYFTNKFQDAQHEQAIELLKQISKMNASNITCGLHEALSELASSCVVLHRSFHSQFQSLCTALNVQIRAPVMEKRSELHVASLQTAKRRKGKGGKVPKTNILPATFIVPPVTKIESESPAITDDHTIAVATTKPLSRPALITANRKRVLKPKGQASQKVMHGMHKRGFSKKQWVTTTLLVILLVFGVAVILYCVL